MVEAHGIEEGEEAVGDGEEYGLGGAEGVAVGVDEG